jgi:DNA topoisomerase-1
VRSEHTPRGLKARFIDSGPAVEAALAAGLRYVSDKQPGIRRERQGDGFVYIGANNQPVEDERVLARITSLAIPPARTNVWICATSHAHIQATGYNAKGRKQYPYHPH